MESRGSDRINLAEWMWGWKPHETQRDWMTCDARTKVAACGRRWGKTEAAAVDAATMALLEPGSVQMIVSPSYDQSRLVFDMVERLILSSDALRPRTKVVRTPYPRLTVTGSVIMARTADEDGRNLRGNAADRVIVDEAAYVRGSVITEVVAPMLADRNGRLVMISTPFGRNHFYEAFRRGQSEGDQTKSFSFPSAANPYISREYIQKQREELSPRQFAVEYEAQFVDSCSGVFAWADVEAAVLCRDEASEFEARAVFPTEGRPAPCVVAGIDWARYSDYTAVVALEIERDGWKVVGIDRFNKASWMEQVDRVVRFLGSYDVCAVMTDATSVGDPVTEVLRDGLFRLHPDCAVNGHVFTNASKREMIDNLALALAQRRLRFPNYAPLIEELLYFEYELTDSGNVIMAAHSGHHDDLVVALALACQQARTLGFAGRYLARNGRVTAGVGRW